MKTITCLDDLIRSRAFECFESDRLGNDLFISDPERAERIHDAAENGSDGSTHSEHIEDWRDANNQFASDVYREQFIAQGYLKDLASELAEALRDYIAAEIDDVESWHEKNGTLNQQCG